MNIILRLIAELIGGMLRGRANRKREEQVQAVADELGLEFMPHVDMLHELSGSDLSISAGPNKACKNCFGGVEEGIRFKVFEFCFVMGCGNSQQVHRQTVACINLAHDCLPDFQVKSKGFFSKLFGKPINAFDTQDPVFGNEYWTCSTEPRRALSFFTEEVKAWIRAHDWSVESNKGRLLVYKAGLVLNESRLKDFLVDSLQLMSKLEDAQINPAPNGSGLHGLQIANQAELIR